MFPSGIEQGGKNREPLRLIEVRPPESPDQFIGLDDDGIPTVDLVFNRPLTAHETHAMLDRYPDAKVTSDGAFSDTGQGIVKVALPFGELNDAAGFMAEIAKIIKSAASYEARHRERLYNWEEVAAAINKTLQQ